MDSERFDTPSLWLKESNAVPLFHHRTGHPPSPALQQIRAMLAADRIGRLFKKSFTMPEIQAAFIPRTPLILKVLKFISIFRSVLQLRSVIFPSTARHQSLTNDTVSADIIKRRSAFLLIAVGVTVCASFMDM